MRNAFVLLAGVCLLSASAAAASPAGLELQTPKPAAQEAKPAPSEAKPTERKEIKLTDKVLKTYVGEYQMGPERTLTITLESGSLWGQPTDQQKRQLFAESQTKFFLKDLPVQVTFQKDAKGNVVGMLMDQEGRPQRELKKVK